MTQTSSPILWYGDLVDFGSFKSAVCDESSDEPISFSFVVDELGRDDGEDRRLYYEPRALRYSLSDVHLDVSIIGTGERTRLSRVLVRIARPALQFEILIGEGSKIIDLKVNGRNLLGSVKSLDLQITPGTILPELNVLPADPKPPRHSRFSSRPFYYFSTQEREFVDLVAEVIRPHLKRLGQDWTDQVAERLLTLRPLNKLTVRRYLGKVGPLTVQKFISEICGKDRHGILQKVEDISAVASLQPILAAIRYYLREVITSTLYIGPARARSERYYRYQDLAVSEIDPNGTNFPMFLNSLSPHQISQLSQWIENLFGYGLSVSRQEGGGHMSINLTQQGLTSNIVDTGYGVSQILPVLGQIWWARHRPRTVGRAPLVSLLAIEQPELHLHPAHQALLADALVGEVSADGNGSNSGSDRIHFLIETHSETLLNRLGELVARGQLSHDDVQVVIFDATDSESHLTDVSTSSFGEDGVLIDWPYGFFQPSTK
jgi:AAA ATPase-like protein